MFWPLHLQLKDKLFKGVNRKTINSMIIVFKKLNVCCIHKQTLTTFKRTVKDQINQKFNQTLQKLYFLQNIDYFEKCKYWNTEQQFK